MDPFVSLNFEILTAADARINAVSSAAFYGRGVFTTVAIVEGEPVLWEKHWRRLTENADQIDIDLSQISEENAATALAGLIRQNNCINGRARITILDELSGGPWHSGQEAKTGFLIAISSVRKKIKNLRLTSSPYRCNSTSPLAGVKSCNYLEPLIAMDEAKTRGFDEAVRLNERGDIASACMANVFWLRDERLFTPGPGTGCLPGTTREFILENLACEEVEEKIDAIREAEEIFLASAGIGVVQVGEFEGTKLRRGDHPITRVLPF